MPLQTIKGLTGTLLSVALSVGATYPAFALPVTELAQVPVSVQDWGGDVVFVTGVVRGMSGDTVNLQWVNGDIVEMMVPASVRASQTISDGSLITVGTLPGRLTANSLMMINDDLPVGTRMVITGKIHSIVGDVVTLQVAPRIYRTLRISPKAQGILGLVPGKYIMALAERQSNSWVSAADELSDIKVLSEAWLVAVLQKTDMPNLVLGEVRREQRQLLPNVQPVRPTVRPDPAPVRAQPTAPQPVVAPAQPQPVRALW